MAPSHYVDIHPHIISSDDGRYPRTPLFGVQSDWSRERPITIEQYVAEMDAAGVQQAAIVQASTCYGYDNSYLTDSIARYPGRLTAVGSVDLTDAGAPAQIRNWMTRGVSGLRLFTGGSTRAFDPSSLDDRRSFPAWELCSEAGVSICLQTDPTGLAQVAGLAKRFPRVKIILDHLSRPDISDGAPYKNASSLFGLQPFENIHLKLTPRTVEKATSGNATPETFFARLVDIFGSHRIAWGSNFPASAGPLSRILSEATKALQCLPASDQEWIFGKTAQHLYPSLAQ
ncbi:MAG TPA: amidohydrolase family protein [Vicinamibacterales bacterium]|nr:amidohydrolase family protein [Vicinamibacterales bacterium]